MAATLATVETYLTAAQAAIGDSDYAEARKQVLLAEMELAKLPQSDATGARTLQTRITEHIHKLYSAIDALEEANASASSTRRTTARLS
jgi:hypothetical protein